MTFNWEWLKEKQQNCTPGVVESLVYEQIIPFRKAYVDHMARAHKPDILRWGDNITILLHEMIRDKNDQR